MGGSGGNDPSWQLFDNLMGFDFSGLLKEHGFTVNTMTFGMTAKQR
jgi:hypothetical protein